MSTLALGSSSAHAPGRAHAAPSLFDDLGREPTLDEFLAGVWEGLAAHHSVCCPACGGEMAPVYGTHAPPPDDSGAAGPSEAGRRGRGVPGGGRCRGCDTTLG
ncbi:MAG: hypothetical protein ACR2MK_07805 [Solirubrobacteraceae bacterium]